jgi:hypothetical protein
MYHKEIIYDGVDWIPLAVIVDHGNAVPSYMNHY